MNNTYRVVIKGVRDGFAEEAVIERLVPLFKASAERVRAKFRSGSFAAKKAVDLATAEKYRAFLEHHGCVCVVERIGAAPAPDHAPSAAPAPAPAAPAPAATAPAPVPAKAAKPACAQCGAQGYLIGALCEHCAGLAMMNATLDITGTLPPPSVRLAMAELKAIDSAIDITSKLPALKPTQASAPKTKNAEPGTMTGKSGAARPVPPPAPKPAAAHRPPREPRGFTGRIDLRHPAKRGEMKQRPLHGRGEIIFTRVGINIRGQRSRLLWFSASEAFVIAYDHIIDAAADGTRVYFSVEVPNAKRRHLCFAATTIDEAREILALLPARQSEGLG